MRLSCAGLCILALLWMVPPDGARADDYWLFESAPVRPLALSPDGTRLFALNPPAARLEIFSVHAQGLTRIASVPVGQEPVAVAALSDAEVWVVNHLSDSVSVVDVASAPPRVVRTLLVGDEPGDVVFAGTPAQPGDPFPRAFITTAHRGQVHPLGPGGARYGDFETSSVRRADVWVFDTANPGAALGGTPETILTLFGDTPRALAARPDGQKVYASVFLSGSRTTTIPAGVLPADPADPPGPSGLAKPETGRIARFDGSAWLDPFGNDVSSVVTMSLPDYDVFEIDAAATTPVQTQAFAGVGTVLFGLAVEPVSGRVWIANTAANNAERFEPEVRSELHRAQLSIVEPSGATVTPRPLNPHIDYETFPSPPGTAELSLATPNSVGFAADGTLYVTAYGSGVLAELDAVALLAGTRTPALSEQIALSGGGPAGVVVDETWNRVYVYTRFDNAVSVVDRALRREVAHLPLPNPEPAEVRDGRPWLYDARLTSSNGEASCAGCHVFGDQDGLAWDLGDPNGAVAPNPNPFELGFGFFFHPMKGPMTTQSLRGMEHHGPLHWRGDRTNAGDPLDVHTDFLEFNGAFVGLMGRAAPLSPAEMGALADFALSLRYPPNPVRSLDNALAAAEAAGDIVFDTPFTDSAVSACFLCHVRDPANGHFGSAGASSDVGGEAQDFKIPHLRNLYQKVGLFGAVAGPLHPSTGPPGLDQVRGFGFTHDGSVDTLDSFLAGPNFHLPADPGDPPGDVGAVARANLVELLLGFPTGLAPIVGQQASYSTASAGSVGPRVDLFEARAQAPDPRPGDPAATECDLVAHGVIAGEARGFLFSGSAYTPDKVAEPALSSAQLRALATSAAAPLTFTCVPPGSGLRLALDRDRDGLLDGDDACPDAPDAGAPDADGDGLPDACDNCGQRANPGQEDVAGVGDGSLADGIGNLCQCGDLDLDGAVRASDVATLRAALADPTTPLSPAQADLCSVIGGGADCDLRDVVALRRTLADLRSVAELGVCAAAVP